MALTLNDRQKRCSWMARHLVTCWTDECDWPLLLSEIPASAADDQCRYCPVGGQCDATGTPTRRPGDHPVR